VKVGGSRKSGRRTWLYVEDEVRWIAPLRLAAGRNGRHVVHVDPSPASPGEWSEYPARLLRRVEHSLRIHGLTFSEISLFVLDIYYPAAPMMPPRALARHGQFVPGGILLARELEKRTRGRVPVVFYSSKSHTEMSPAQLRRLLRPPGRYYLLKLSGGASGAARWLSHLD